MTMASDFQTLNTSQSDTSKPTLPSPQIFDVLPALHELLARIERAPPDTTDLQQPSSSYSGDESSNDIGAHYQDQAPLEPKDLQAEVLAIKTKIRKALREVERLPDMESSVGEQEEEIAELEERIGRQRAMLRRFGEMGRGGGLR